MVRQAEIVFDPLEEEYLEDPYPVLRELRERRPVHWHDTLQSWVVTRYDDCRAVMQNSAHFATDRRRLGVDVPDVMLSVQTIDPPEHTELRRLLHRMLRSVDMA